MFLENNFFHKIERNDASLFEKLEITIRNLVISKCVYVFGFI